MHLIPKQVDIRYVCDVALFKNLTKRVFTKKVTRHFIPDEFKNSNFVKSILI